MNQRTKQIAQSLLVDGCAVIPSVEIEYAQALESMGAALLAHIPRNKLIHLRVRDCSPLRTIYSDQWPAEAIEDVFNGFIDASDGGRDAFYESIEQTCRILGISERALAESNVLLQP